MLHQIDENKTSMVTKLLKHWQAGEVAEKAWLSDYCGSRYDQLLEIHGCLKTLFTCDQHIVYGWVTSQNKAFDGKTPLDVMLHEADGISQIVHYLRIAIQR